MSNDLGERENNANIRLTEAKAKFWESLADFVKAVTIPICNELNRRI